MRMVKRSLFLIILSILWSGFTRPTALRPAIAEQSSQFEPADCQFEIPQRQRVDCGYLTVPADHHQPDGPTLRLHVAIFHSHSLKPEPDPVVYLAGGPGSQGLQQIYRSFNQPRFEAILSERDLIMFDQRGVGTSEPALDCPEYTQFSYDILDQNLSAEERSQRSLDALKTCHDRLVAEGVNLSDYTSAQNAADIAALRSALGYQEWNLYGLSYGSRLALTVMRDYPEGLRSVVLDSTYPLEVDLYTEVPANAIRAFNTLFDNCAADPTCNAAYPDLKTVFYDVVHQLDENPITIEVNHPLTQKTYAMHINGDSMIGFLFQSLYAETVIPSLPQIIYDVKAGRYAMFAHLMQPDMSGTESLSIGMHYAVECSEEASFTTPDDLETAYQAYPELVTHFKQHLLGQGILSICDMTNVQAAPEVENEPVHSEIPTLILAGEYDPVTPPEWGKLVAGHLNHSYFFEFPDLGHDISISNPCAINIMLAFWDNPTAEPNGLCVQDMTGLAFTLPLNEIKLVPFTNTQFGIEGVAPEGWIDEFGIGVFSANLQGVPMLMQQSASNISAQMVFDMFKSMLPLTQGFTEVGTRESNGLRWTLYQLEAPNIVLDLAIVKGSPTKYTFSWIVLVSSTDNHEILYNAVFLPAVDALQPSQS